jgi:hypothetical protein
MIGDNINHEVLAEHRISIINRSHSIQERSHHAPGMQRGRELGQVGLGSKGWVYRPNILCPVSMVCRPAVADQQTSKSWAHSDGTAAHPSRELPSTCLTMGEIHTAVNPMPWM